MLKVWPIHSFQSSLIFKQTARAIVSGGFIFPQGPPLELYFIVMCHFQILEMIHLYIYFKQKTKKNLCFSVAVFFLVFVLRKTQLAGKLLLKECLFRKSCAYWEKNSILGCFWELSY
jgi:hypothetical protein